VPTSSTGLVVRADEAWDWEGGGEGRQAVGGVRQKGSAQETVGTGESLVRG
jgi:hypothetical protein